MSDPIVQGIKGALARELDARNISVRELARGADISTALAGFLRNDRNGTSLTRAERIAAFLDLPVGALFAHKNGDPIGGA